MYLDIKNRIEEVEVGDLLYCTTTGLAYLIVKSKDKYTYTELINGKINDLHSYDSIYDLLEFCFGNNYFKLIKSKDIKLSFEY